MAWCSGCQAERPDDLFARNGKRKQGRCRDCDAAKKRETRDAKWKDVGWIIDNTDRCLFHAARVDYCRRKATWRSGQWRACDEHRHKEDVPIIRLAKLDGSPLSNEEVQEGATPPIAGRRRARRPG